ncbi:5891_t:CDS:2 [Cetraspora pellucida]|uniref:5891_t:CDS:1 n=1 Tax=Cetraspora pellucida TaxID=1433469 RepID=A0A9N8ZDH6_9GLOM|nr:5891_t:CDS:2 [Cetraspora pellucida]
MNTCSISSEQPQSSIKFPLQTRQTARVINGVHTETLITGFRDKILVIITQYGKIGSLAYVTFDSLSSKSLSSFSTSTTTNINFLLGGFSSLYQLYALHIATIIANENPNDRRSVVIGLALKNAVDDKDVDNKELIDCIELMVRECKPISSRAIVVRSRTSFANEIVKLQLIYLYGYGELVRIQVNVAGETNFELVEINSSAFMINELTFHIQNSLSPSYASILSIGNHCQHKSLKVLSGTARDWIVVEGKW